MVSIKRKIEVLLRAWKDKTADRMPLIVSGARQVGKTHTLREFGDRYFKNVVYVNLEVNQAVASYFNEDIEPERLIRYLPTLTARAPF